MQTKPIQVGVPVYTGGRYEDELAARAMAHIAAKAAPEEKQYHVTWEIEVYAESPRAAAEKCLAIHRNPESIATVFDVIEFETSGEAVRIDLSEGDDEQGETNDPLDM